MTYRALNPPIISGSHGNVLSQVPDVITYTALVRLLARGGGLRVVALRAPRRAPRADAAALGALVAP
jgi:hypothetical protein